DRVALAVVFVAAAACVSVPERLLLPENQAVVVLGLALIPAAPSIGVHAWIVVITLLATSVMWFIPSQTNSYLVAYSAAEGRLFSHAQGRLAAFLYAGVTLIALAVCVLTYWRLLGLT